MWNPRCKFVDPNCAAERAEYWTWCKLATVWMHRCLLHLAVFPSKCLMYVVNKESYDWWSHGDQSLYSPTKRLRSAVENDAFFVVMCYRGHRTGVCWHAVEFWYWDNVCVALADIGFLRTLATQSMVCMVRLGLRLTMTRSTMMWASLTLLGGLVCGVASEVDACCAMYLGAHLVGRPQHQICSCHC